MSSYEDGDMMYDLDKLNAVSGTHYVLSGIGKSVESSINYLISSGGIQRKI